MNRLQKLVEEIIHDSTASCKGPTGRVYSLFNKSKENAEWWEIYYYLEDLQRKGFTNEYIQCAAYECNFSINYKLRQWASRVKPYDLEEEFNSHEIMELLTSYEDS